MSKTAPCVLRGCENLGVCLDNKNYTKWNADLFVESDATPGREIWYCSEHAAEYLFPIIDAQAGFTVDAILKDFRKDGM